MLQWSCNFCGFDPMHASLRCTCMQYDTPCNSFPSCTARADRTIASLLFAQSLAQARGPVSPWAYRATTAGNNLHLLRAAIGQRGQSKARCSTLSQRARPESCSPSLRRASYGRSAAINSIMLLSKIWRFSRSRRRRPSKLPPPPVPRHGSRVRADSRGPLQTQRSTKDRLAAAEPQLELAALP